MEDTKLRLFPADGEEEEEVILDEEEEEEDEEEDVDIEDDE